MIAFLTLFLGLVTGDRPVELQVTGEVARVEVSLDGVLLATLREEPWQVVVPFGGELRPHRLEAAAFDLTGAELDRVGQWINLSRSAAEATLHLDLDPRGAASVATVSWVSVTSASPRAVRVELDGRPLSVTDVASFPLPPYDPNHLHFLRVELDFAEDVVAVAEATFGGFFADSVNTELTPILISLERDREVTLADLSGRFLVAGEEVDPVVVERGASEVILIRDVTTHDELARTFRILRGQHVRYGPKDLSLRYYWTVPVNRQVDERTYLLYNHSAEVDLRTLDMVRAFLVAAHQPSREGEVQLIGGAAAVAGMASLERDRRRAVVVILGEPGTDRSMHSPEVIRGYLDAIDVPLVVWSTAALKWKGVEHGWGEIKDVRQGWGFLRGLDQVLKGLEKQRLVWFAGRHLPDQIEVRPGSEFSRATDSETSAREP